MIEEYALPNGTLGFDSKKHRYYYNSEVIPGVTSLVKILAPTDILMAWAVKETGQFVQDNISGVDTADPVEVTDFVRQAKRAWRDNRSKKGDIGTMVHAYIEQWMRSFYLGWPSPPMPENEYARNACNGFLGWIQQQDVVVHGLEQKVLFRGGHGLWPYAGTYDADLTINGKRYICDWKTANRINPEMAAQMGGYHMALEDMFGGDIWDGHMIIRCDRESGEVQTWETENTVLDKLAFAEAFKLVRFREGFRA